MAPPLLTDEPPFNGPESSRWRRGGGSKGPSGRMNLTQYRISLHNVSYANSWGTKLGVPMRHLCASHTRARRPRSQARAVDGLGSRKAGSDWRRDGQAEERAAVGHHERAAAVSGWRHAGAIRHLDAVDQLAAEWRQQEDAHARRGDQQRAVDWHRRRYAAARHLAPPQLATGFRIEPPQAGRAARGNQDRARGLWWAAVAPDVCRSCQSVSSLTPVTAVLGHTCTPVSASSANTPPA